MSDVYVPGIKSRFNTEQLVEDLMKVERIPKDRAERNVERLTLEKTYWQDLGRRMSTLRESARFLYSFQNPFNDRIVSSKDDAVISGTATREAVEQERSFMVKQVAASDRFMSEPLEDSYKVDKGIYTFKVGEEEVSFDFRGSSLKDFTEALTRRGRGKIKASLITVKQGTKSLLIESMATGAANKLDFLDNAEQLGLKVGMIERVNKSRKDIGFDLSQMKTGFVQGMPENAALVTLNGTIVEVKAGGMVTIPINPPLTTSPTLLIKYDTQTVIGPQGITTEQPPSGPSIPSPGGASYGGITIENDPFLLPLPPSAPPAPPSERIDDKQLLFLNFSDGTQAALPAIDDTNSFKTQEYSLADFARGKTIVSLEIINDTTHRDLSIQNVQVYDPQALGGLAPRLPVSVAQDAIVAMDGIEVQRPKNDIDDLIPGVTLSARGTTDRPVKLNIEPDRDAIKESIITLVGNYNRLVAELNVLTRNDEAIIPELTYLTEDEQKSLKERLGAFSGDSTLTQLKNSLQRIVTSPYPTSTGQNVSMLTQIGIGTDVRRTGSSTGYDATRLRGYLEIDEKSLDAALQSKMLAVQQLFGYDTDGDYIVDSGIGFSMENFTRSYVETGGVITLKTSTIDTKVSQERQRIDSLDRQLAGKEASLKKQYGQVEGSYSRMEQMSTRLDQFSNQNSNKR
ncbi:flagellar filament capping protein FliD [Breznakiellaceae bacterium SP9]